MSHSIEQINMEPQQEQHTSHDHGDHQELFESAWVKSQSNALIEGLRAGKNITEVLADMPGFAKSFSDESLLNHPDCCLQCSDGRVKNDIKVALAGEGLLLNDADRAILVAAIKDRQLMITGHESCGAAAIARPGTESDQYGHEKAQRLAADSGNRYRAVDHSEFRSSIHDERALVLDGTMRFNCADWSNFPPQFLSSAAAFGLSDEYIKTETKALSGIALGDHGFGARFDAANPFCIVIAAQNQEQLNHLLDIAKSSVEEFGDRVRVDGFIAPEKKG